MKWCLVGSVLSWVAMEHWLQALIPEEANESSKLSALCLLPLLWKDYQSLTGVLQVTTSQSPSATMSFLLNSSHLRQHLEGTVLTSLLWRAPCIFSNDGVNQQFSRSEKQACTTERPEPTVCVGV